MERGSKARHPDRDRPAGALPARHDRRRKEAIRVCIVEHHPLADDRLREILQREPGFHVLRQGDIRARHSGSARDPLVVVVDIETLPAPVATWLRSLRSEISEGKIIALGHPLEDDQTCQLLLSGVHGFVPYDRLEKDVNRAIKSVWEGRLWVKPSVLRRFVECVRKVSQPGKEAWRSFTAREKEILPLLPARLSNKEIASKVGISQRTVRFHLANIFTKLGVHDRYSAADLLRAGVVNVQAA